MLNASLLTVLSSPRPATPTKAQVLAAQAYAISIGDAGLKEACWTALGFSSRYSFTPVTVDERDRALAVVAGHLEMMACMGQTLATVEV